MQTDQSGKPGIRRTPLNLESLASEARSAEGGEAYAELSRSPGYRLGVVASTFPSGCVYYTVECTFRLFSPDASVETTMLERAAEITRRLERMGYDLTHLDDGWISCEKIMPREAVDAEVNGLLHFLVLWARQQPGGLKTVVDRLPDATRDSAVDRHPGFSRADRRLPTGPPSEKLTDDAPILPCLQDRVGSGVDAVDLRRLAGGFCVLVGIMMGTAWGVLFTIGQVPEISTVPIELGFLLVAEFLTAGSLVLGGLGLVLRKSWAYRAYLVATGLLLYSITNYLGGLIQRGELAMAAFIGVMGVLTVVFFTITLPKKGALNHGIAG